MTDARIYDFLEYRRRTDTPEPLRTMTPQQYEQRKLMEAGEWVFIKITALNEVAMQFGDPGTKMAFIQDSGFTEEYQLGE